MAPLGMEPTTFQLVVQCPQLCMYEGHAKCEPCAIKGHCNSSNREMHITGPFLVRPLTSWLYWSLCGPSVVCAAGYGGTALSLVLVRPQNVARRCIDECLSLRSEGSLNGNLKIRKQR